MVSRQSGRADAQNEEKGRRRECVKGEEFSGGEGVEASSIEAIETSEATPKTYPKNPAEAIYIRIPRFRSIRSTNPRRESETIFGAGDTVGTLDAASPYRLSGTLATASQLRRACRADPKHDGELVVDLQFSEKVNAAALRRESVWAAEET